MSREERDWWRGAVIYQVYPRSFADTNGDGIGDLPGITTHLDYIASLGVEAIWLSPFFTSPMRDFGYDVSNYRDVDPMFGTLADFDALLARAHALGLRVIIDQIYSHTSDQHPWFAQSRASREGGKADWYVWADPRPDGTPPSNWQSIFGGPAWQWDARRGQYYLHNFLASQPDLNVHNRDVQDALIDAARFWLERGVDGFRIDAINFAMHDPQLRDNPPSPASGRPRTRPVDFQRALYNHSHPDVPRFLERIRELTESFGGRFTVAEVGGEDAEPTMQLYTSGQDRLHTAYGFNFLYADTLTPSLVKRAVEAWPEGRGAPWPSWAFSNHDAPRAVTRWAAGRGGEGAQARLNLLLLLSLRGNVFIYQGEELGLPQSNVSFEHLKDPEAISNWPLTLGRDGARTPMPWQAGIPHARFSVASPWLPVNAAHHELAVDRQERDAGSTLAVARRLLAMRRTSAALRVGSIVAIEASERRLTFERRLGEECMLCAFNLGDAAESWAPPVTRKWSIVEAVGGATIDSLPPRSGLIARELR